jgi:hypothetical protein
MAARECRPSTVDYGSYGMAKNFEHTVNKRYVAAQRKPTLQTVSQGIHFLLCDLVWQAAAVCSILHPMMRTIAHLFKSF